MKVLFLFSFFLFSISLHATEKIIVIAVTPQPTTEVFHEEAQHLADTIRKEDKKVISAFLAFPFPLGILGAHRIYMGAKPYVPLIYIATLGGCFGILPLIDFIVIVSKKDISPYQNDKIFMWLK